MSTYVVIIIVITAPSLHNYISEQVSTALSVAEMCLRSGRTGTSGRSGPDRPSGSSMKDMNHLNTTEGLTIGPEERWREEAFVHQTREGDNADHVVGVKGQATERLTVQLLWEKNKQNNRRRILIFKGPKHRK